ncbi:MAG: hypothetical protein JRD89_02550 [Deltaproteobacteria bacterium]|nr:hypothetical protein [Deltaproteobacteria bacterium]
MIGPRAGRGDGRGLPRVAKHTLGSDGQIGRDGVVRRRHRARGELGRRVGGRQIGHVVAELFCAEARQISAALLVGVAAKLIGAGNGLHVTGLGRGLSKHGLTDSCG